MTLFTVQFVVLLLIAAYLSWAIAEEPGILFPQTSETREMISLDGIWKFFTNTSNEGIKMNLMPVPSSYNDILTEMGIRDYVGIVQYERVFFVPKSWKGHDVWIRFGSVNYGAYVIVNEIPVVQHLIGHLPFQAKISGVVNYGMTNKVVVIVDNRLWPTTIPQGNVSTIKTDEGDKLFQTYTFDFYNYAGIHRPVYLVKTPFQRIDDVTITTDLINSTLAIINYSIKIGGDVYYPLVTGVKVYDGMDLFLTSVEGTENAIKVVNPKLWWPYLMNPDDTTPGYLYKLQIELHDASGSLVDIYRMKVGIRSLEWTNSTFNINGKPLYMRGFGRHEDSDIRGRGLDFATIIKDHNLIKWIGGNAYRTSHYPYAEEIMQLTDELGIMIIAECPAVNIQNVTTELMNNHIQSIKEMIQRDKNHPSIVAWSVANEPRSHQPDCKPYWENVTIFTKFQDLTRPITASLNTAYEKDNLAPFLDIISFNRYNSWYQNEGQLDMIINMVTEEANAWRNKYNKPVLMSEYGADTMEGLHLLPAYIWSEEYQVELLTKHFKAFDILRNNEWFIGEFVWNFADFKTSQKTTRVGGNKKGMFTRQRQPKAAAHLLRKRYFHLAQKLDNVSLPADLEEYVIDKKNVHVADEL